MGKPIDLTGHKFGKLAVLKKLHDTKGRVKWLCACECGNLTEIRTDVLRSGMTKSCGCLRVRHNKTDTKLYKVWLSMKQRCYNKRDKAYKNYGQRGIKMCDEWKDNFQVFYDWCMANGYKKGLTIDRIDNDKYYEPNNCRLVDRKTQQRNRRSCIYYKINGEKHCLMEWCEILGLNYSTVNGRLHHNWSIERALELEERK